MSEAAVECLGVVGGGLIGSSLARAAAANGLARRVVVIDQDAEVVAQIRALGIAQDAACDSEPFAEAADLVALATPVRAMGEAAAVARALLKPGGAAFDTGSVKGAVMAPVREALGEARTFVPAHPIAGTERSGPAAGFASLFDNRWCILTPRGDEPEDAVADVAAFWSGCGARVAVMSPEEHDALLALTSHAPHLIAYALTGTAAAEDGAPRADMVRYSAGGFRDFTRIAASDPVMWRDVFLSNRDAVLAALDRFEANLAALRAAVEAGDGAALEARFAATRAVRAEIVAAGQETPAPDFGRGGGDQ